MPKKPYKTLTPVERIEAEQLAEEMLLNRTTMPAITRALVTEYGVSAGIARGVTKKAIARIQKAVEESRPHRRAQQIASLDRLHERAVSEGKLSVAVSVQKLLAKIEGTEKPMKVEHVGLPAAAGKDDFEGRTTDEIEYYVAHGYWPEEAPEDDGQESPVATDGPEFPLH